MIMVKSITHLIKYEKLKMQNHFLEMLTATVSHDMRTPLNSILGLGKNLEQHITTTRGLRFLGVMMNSAKLLHFLVNDLIDLFRIRNGKFETIE
jgi:signal transduction histidine kinase